jgi:hypothetical protein
MTARLALTGKEADWRMPEHPAQPPAARPYLIMNPRSGGGRVEKFDLKRKAEELGAEVFLMSGPELVDVAEVAREAVAGGAGLSRRARLDRGILGVVGVRVRSARQAVGLLRGVRAAGLSVLAAKEIEILADAPAHPGRHRR